MKRRFFLALFVASAVFFLGSLVSADEPARWQAGLAKSRITPEAGLWMAGYAARDHAAEGTMHDLWIKALALADAEGNEAVLVSFDLLGLPCSMYETICGELKDRCDLQRADIMLCASHTHCGPVLRGALYDIYPLDDDQLARIEDYSTNLEATFVDTIAAAMENMRPARLAVGISSATFAANRRALRTGATGEAAPVDHTVPVMTVSLQEDNLRAIVFGYACHATTLMAYEWNGDYPGFAQLALEERFPGAEAIFVAGCGADQNPHPRRSVELCRQHGGALADAVGEAIEGPKERISPKLKTAIELIELPYGEQPSVEYLKETAAGNGYRSRWAQRLLEEIAAGKQFATSYPAYPVQLWRLGEHRLVALGGEVVVDFASAIPERLGPKTWVAAYANDVMAYIPSERVRAEGGYEAGAFSVYGLPAIQWSADVEERILRAVERVDEKTGPKAK